MQIGKYRLDKSQIEIVKDESNYILVTAGAGSGKTLTILGKINYLVKEKNIKEEEILCISFTKASAESLKQKLKTELNLIVPTYTFHKLSLEIIKDKNYEIADEYLLEEITNEFYQKDIFTSPHHLKLICNYLNKRNLKSYEDILNHNKKELMALEKLCITFIHLMKCNNYKIEDFLKFIKTIKKTIFYKKYQREKTLLIFILNIYLKYENYLQENKEIDFDDMIIKATKEVKEYGLKKNIKYIIIDEYQDTSLIRFNLINEIIKKTSAKLMVVGDDFQSIYRFTGCDISLFLNFKNYFPNAKIMKLEKTYRNSNELIKIAGKFIMKNKNQIKKQLYSSKHEQKPIIILKYKDIKDRFMKVIKELSKYEKQTILILGRNNNDIYLLLDKNIKLQNQNRIIIKDYEFLKITYMTIHKSKGLESDNVILINLENKITGFPNQLKDEKIIRLVVNRQDKYPYSEERRLFYVALTRTKNKVYLLVPQKNPSIFIEELSTMLN